MSYKILSFNIQKFSRVATSLTGKKDLDTIARIIRESDADIIALQEVVNKEALKELLEAIAQQYAQEDQLKRGNKSFDGLGRYSVRTNDIYGYRTKHWEGRWGSPVSAFGGIAAEGYAFIWNRDRIKLVTNYEGESFEPRIETFSGKNKLVRPPFVGRFMPVNGRFELRLINVHIAFSVPARMKHEDDPLYKPDVKDQELREGELKRLLDTVYTNWDKKQYDVNQQDRNARPLVPYTFLLGDYNLNLQQSTAKGSKIPKNLEIRINGDMEIVTVNEALTTLKQKPGNAEEAKKREIDRDANLANNYDHFSYDRVKLSRHQIDKPQVGVIYAFEQYKSTGSGQTQYDQYREQVSDHLPIFLTIHINRRHADITGGYGK